MIELEMCRQNGIYDCGIVKVEYKYEQENNMIEIKGKYNTAKVFVDDYDKLEEACYKQIKE